jgi:hypothetical protein
MNSAATNAAPNAPKKGILSNIANFFKPTNTGNGSIPAAPNTTVLTGGKRRKSRKARKSRKTRKGSKGRKGRKGTRRH